MDSKFILCAALLTLRCLSAYASPVDSMLAACREAAGFDSSDDILRKPRDDAKALCGDAIRSNAHGLLYLARLAWYESDTKLAVNLLDQASRKGNASAVALLGSFYEYGDMPGGKNSALAANFYKEAAKHGAAAGYRRLGELQRDGEGVKKDVFAAAASFRTAIDLGSVVAALRLSSLYDDGRGVPKSSAESFKWLKHAADGGSPPAQFLVYEAYLHGDGTPVDKVAALQWLRKSADAGDLDAMEKLGALHFMGSRDVDQDLPLACKYFGGPAEDGRVLAQAVLGTCYLHGIYYPVDKKVAIKWLRRAAQKKHPLALRLLADQYAKGEAVAMDYHRANDLYRQAVAVGSSEAERELAVQLLLASPRRSDSRTEALARLQRASANDDDARFLLLRQEPVEQALAELRRQVAVDPVRGMPRLIQYLLTAELHSTAIHEAEGLLLSEAFERLESETKDKLRKKLLSALGQICAPALSGAAEERSLATLERLGVAEASLHLGTNALGAGNDRLAFEHLSLAANRGSARAMAIVASLYDRGKGVEKNSRLAFDWFRKAEELGDNEARIALAFKYYDGSGVEKDDSRAFALSSFAAVDSGSEALLLKGVLLIEGRGTPKDVKQGLQALSSASERGSAAASLFLGSVYKEGKYEIAADAKTAIDFYRRALAPRSETGTAMFHFQGGLLSNPAEIERLASLALAELSSLDQSRVPQSSTAAGSNAEIKTSDKGAVTQEVLELERRAGVAADNYQWHLAARHYIVISDILVARGDFGAAVAARLKSLAFHDLASTSLYGDEANYFALLDSSCRWAQASRWALDAEHRELSLPMAKIAVRKLDEAAAQLATLGERVRECFLKVHEDRYRWLAELLIKMGQIPEAERVLAKLKAFEVREYLREPTRGDEGVLALGEREQALVDHTHLLKQRVTAASRRRELQETIQLRQLSISEQIELASANELLAKTSEQLNKDVQDLIAQLRSQFQGVQTSSEATLTASRAMQRTLRETFGNSVVILQTVVLPHNAYLIVTTGDIQHISPLTITREDLAARIADFRGSVQDPARDPRELAKWLYDLLLRPVESLLPSAGTILFSPDDVLRYLPLACLFDGKQYLIQRFQIALYDPNVQIAILEKVGKELSKVAGFGVSEARPDLEFGALPKVETELKAIVRQKGESSGVLPGVRHLNKDFTRSALAETLFAKVPAVHIASHFRLVPADVSRSVLLLGVGPPLSLSDLVAADDLSMSNVSLLTLSACETAVPIGRRDPSGQEVESLSALVHKGGARAVIATNWQISDVGTALFMRILYTNLASNAGSVSSALREAQLSFLLGSASLNGDVPTGILAHPYYWAGFSLVGSWR